MPDILAMVLSSVLATGIVATPEAVNQAVSQPPKAAAQATKDGLRAYDDPPFAGKCHWHHYKDGEAPPLSLLGTEPLCVEYSKRDITVSNGGAIRFVLAEPTRFALAIPACDYWQRDHWRVRLLAGQRPLIGWDGSYWFDKAHGQAAARLRNFTINGRRAGIGDVVTLLRPVAPLLADQLAAYGSRAGETGGRAVFPGGLPCPK